jgi:hypothetical protein
MNTNQIKCPNCGTLIDIDEVLKHQADEMMKVEQEKLEKQKREFEEKKSRENELFTERLEKEKQRISKEEEEKAKKMLDEQYQLQLKSLNEENEKRKQENNVLKEKELAFLKREELLKEKEQDIDLKVQRQLKEERELVEEKIKKQEQEKNDLKFKEYEKKLEQTQKALEDATRKASQGSMQLQGEVQEIALEILLKESFPFDRIEEVSKGVRGADCIQIVRNNFGQECGKIIYESKRTQAFANEWIEKLKADMRAQNADIAVLVTQAMPKDMEQFGEKSGVWICTFSEVKAVANILRNSIVKISAIAKSQDNKGDKMQLLYDYLTGSEFSEQWKAIREGFMSMKHSIDTERAAMEKIWKSREKQLEKIVLNAAHISGSVEGIAGMEHIDLKLLDTAEEGD